ncbi:MAG TPA: YncE family protein [Chloroflexia bacterium]|nr:YncE family protein [Chloroflexia bacterium]
MKKMIRFLIAFVALGTMCLGLISQTGPAGAQTPKEYGFVLNEDSNSLSIIEASTGKVLTVHDMNGILNKPHLSDYDRATHRLYVGNKGSNFVVLDMTDPMAPKVVANIKPGGNGEIHRVVLAGGLVWIAHEGDSTVYAYDLNNFSAPTVKLGKDFGFDTTHGLTLRPGTNELWASNRPINGMGTIIRIDVQTRSIVGKPLLTTGRVGDRPNNTEFTSDGKWAYVVNTGSKTTQVTVVDAEKFEVVKQIEQDATVGVAPHAIVYDPVTTRMFIVNKDSPTLSAISTKTNSVLGYFTIGAEPHGITLGPDGMIYATAKKGNKVVEFDPQRLTVIKEITDPKMIGPHQIIFTAGFVQPTATAVPAQPTATTPPTAAPVEPSPTPVTVPTQPAPAPEIAPASTVVVAGMPRTGAPSSDAWMLLLSMLLAAGGIMLGFYARKTAR